MINMEIKVIVYGKGRLTEQEDLPVILANKYLSLKELSPEYSLEGLMLKLKLQYFGHLMRRADSLEKTLMLGKIEGGRRRGQQRMRWLDGITDAMDMGLSKLRVSSLSAGCKSVLCFLHKPQHSPSTVVSSSDFFNVD